MRLTVHIGTTKTGSTSIQAFLRANRAALLERGTCVPESLGPQDHRYAVLSCLNFGQSADLMARQGLTTAAQLTAFRHQTHAAYLAEIAAARAKGAHEVVITSEHLQSRCHQPVNLERFHRLFAQGFEQIRILVYVRPQLDQITSLYSTTLRNGFCETIDEHVLRHMTPTFHRYYDIAGILARWQAVFGPEALLVRPYRALPPQARGGAVADFCTLLGLRHDADGLSHPIETNSSIHAQGQELLRLFNLESAAGRDPAVIISKRWIPGAALETGPARGLRKILTTRGLSVNAQRASLVHWIEAQCSGKGAEASPLAAWRFQRQFRAGNAEVVARYFPGHPEYLSPRWPSLWPWLRLQIRQKLRPQSWRAWRWLRHALGRSRP